jgi:cyclase
VNGWTRRLIPCLDVRAGQVVKGVSFVNLREMGDPVELGLRYQADGADELVVLDVAATAEGNVSLASVVTRLADALSIPLTAGGGIRGAEDAERLFRAGADKVAVNSAAVRRPELLRELADTYGCQAVVLSVDVRREQGDYRVYIAGGRTPTDWWLDDWLARALPLGVGEILLTSVDADGTQQGYDLALVDRVSRAVSVPVIASGGARGAADLLALFRETAASAALLASALHEGKERVSKLKAVLRREGVPVRWTA